MSKFTNLQHCVGYRPGKTLVEYEPLQLHRIERVPTFEKYTRVIRSWDPKLRKIVRRQVDKVLMKSDGKTPRHPIYVNQVEVCPIQAPIRLKAGSPKALYRAAKRAA